MEFLISAYVFILVVLLILGVYWFFVRPSDPAVARLKELTQPEPAKTPIKSDSDLTKLAEQIALPIQRIAPPSAKQARKMQKKLMYAGYINPNAVLIYRALQFSLLLGVPLMTLVVWMLLDRPFDESYPWLLGATFFGYVIPRQVLDNKIKNRQERLRWGLADGLAMATSILTR